jgi:hypothetical protein
MRSQEDDLNEAEIARMVDLLMIVAAARERPLFARL